MKRILYFISFVTLILFMSCRTLKEHPSTESYVPYETECLGSEDDGSVTLRTWGMGKDMKDAIEQAKKNAINDVLFKGVRGGLPDCTQSPLVAEANAREHHAEYFDKFFKDGGDYLDFVSNEDTKKKSAQYYSNQNGEKFGITVRVLRSKLKAKLIKDNIIPYTIKN
jgi:hypothetical protein